MFNEFAVSDAPDVDVAPSEFFSGGLKDRRARTKLDGMIMRCGERYASDDFISADDGIFELHVRWRQQDFSATLVPPKSRYGTL
jgi:hypothetical protein